MSEEIIMLAKRNKTYIQFYYSGQDEPFVCGVDGGITSEIMDEIEVEFLKDCSEEDDSIFNKAGDYLFQVNYEEPQIGEYGRIELAGYWNLDFIKFEPLTE